MAAPPPHPTPRPMAAGHAILVVLIALLVGTLLNARDIQATARRQPFGWQRNVAMAAITPVQALSATLALDRPRTAIDLALGRDPVAPTGAAGATGTTTAAAATPPPPAFAGSAEDQVSAATPPAPRTPTRAEPLRLFVGGDSMVGQFGPALANLARRTGVVDAEFQYEFSSGLTRPDFVDWPARLREVGRRQDPEVLVLIFGGNDAQDLKAGDRLVPLGTPQWRAEYRQRVAQVMGQLGAEGRRVFWVGMPIVRSATFEERVRMLNEIYRTEAAAHPSVTYVDSWELFAGPDGRYAEYLPDETGVLTDMRLNDGIHLTTAGAQRLAARVMALVAAEWALPEGGGSEPAPRG